MATTRRLAAREPRRRRRPVTRRVPSRFAVVVLRLGVGRLRLICIDIDGVVGFDGRNARIGRFRRRVACVAGRSRASPGPIAGSAGSQAGGSGRCSGSGCGGTSGRAGRPVGGVGVLARLGIGPGSSGFATSPVLEGRAYRERARQAVGFLVSQRARRGSKIRVAAVAVIGHRRPLVTIVLERDKRTGGGAVRDGQPAFAHGRMIPKGIEHRTAVPRSRGDEALSEDPSCRAGGRRRPVSGARSSRPTPSLESSGAREWRAAVSAADRRWSSPRRRRAS
jgi:hypothetical protein